MSRPQFVPNEAQRKNVRSMAAYGIPQEEIARSIGVTAKTLRKHFRQEVERATTEANARVAQSLFQQATSGTCAAAAMFWLKCRAGWRENDRAGREAAPSVPFVVQVIQEPEGKE